MVWRMMTARVCEHHAPHTAEALRRRAAGPTGQDYRIPTNAEIDALFAEGAAV